MIPTPEQQERIELVTECLLDFASSHFARGTFSDVYAWITTHRDYSRLDLALVGNPQKVSAVFGMLSGDGESHVMASGVSGALRRAFHPLLKESGFEYNDLLILPEMLSRIAGQTLGLLDAPNPFTEDYLVFIPQPGFPWAEDDEPITYWSAAKRKWITPKRPAWLVEVEDRTDPGKMQLGVNPCVIFAPDEESEQQRASIGASMADRDGEPPVFGRVMHGRANGVAMMVAHSMNLAGGRHKQLDSAIDGIRSCGGLLFPSLSIGPIPASNFGPVSLIGHLDLVFQGLKPYRRRGEASVWVYETDAWTVATGEMQGGWVARQLFEELHGHEDWSSGSHMWILGPPGNYHGGPRGDQTPIDTVSQLAMALKRRMRPWHEELTAEEFDEQNERMVGTDEKYAYCEAKAREVIQLHEFPYLVAPKYMAPVVKKFVSGTGYRGKVVLVPFEEIGEEDPNRDYALYQWAWKVADVVHGLRPVASVRT